VNLSDDERREMLADARDPKRREDFLVADRLTPPMTFDAYLTWLTEMARQFPKPQRTEVTVYQRVLL
jgi:hypothetical protein